MENWKNNRPDGWQNPWEGTSLIYHHRAVFEEENGNITEEIAGAKAENIYEAGADAILEVLLNGDNFINVSKTAIVMPGFMTNLDDYLMSLGNGTFVFIPDEEAKE